MITNIFVGLISAIFGGLVTLSFGIIRARLDAKIKRFEELCSLLTQAADLASEYWLLDRRIATEATGSGPGRVAILEAFLMGQQQQILLLVEQLEAELPGKVQDLLREKQPDLVDGLTGGNFWDDGGGPDSARALIVQTVVAEIVVKIRSSPSEIYTMRYLVTRAWR